MRKSRITESLNVAVLKEREAGVAVGELTRKHGISRDLRTDRLQQPAASYSPIAQYPIESGQTPDREPLVKPLGGARRTVSGLL